MPIYTLYTFGSTSSYYTLNNATQNVKCVTAYGIVKSSVRLKHFWENITKLRYCLQFNNQQFNRNSLGNQRIPHILCTVKSNWRYIFFTCMHNQCEKMRKLHFQRTKLRLTAFNEWTWSVTNIVIHTQIHILLKWICTSKAVKYNGIYNEETKAIGAERYNQLSNNMSDSNTSFQTEHHF